MKRILTTFALVLALPLAVAAQEQEPEMERGMMRGHAMMQGHAMHGDMAMMMQQPGPGMLLQLRGTLGLTDDQVAELEAMQATAHESMQAHREAAAAARTRAHEAMTGDSPDLEAFQAALEEAAQHHVQVMVAMARVHTQAGDVLSDEQQTTLETVMQGMHEMHGQGMPRLRGEGMGEGMPRRMRSGG